MDMHERHHQTQSVSRTRLPNYERRALAPAQARAMGQVARSVSIGHEQQVAIVSEQQPRTRHKPAVKTTIKAVKVHIQNSLGHQQRMKLASWVSVGLIIVSMVTPLLGTVIKAKTYDLSDAKGVVGTTTESLKSKLTYDGTKQSWVFNKDAAQQLPGSTSSSAKVGGLTYTAQLPSNISSSSGMVLTDAQSKLDITLKPEFALGSAEASDGRVVYPLAGSSSKLVYSFKQDGVKEDIVLYESPGDSAEYSYDLQLPKGLEARLQQDGSIGVFGGDTNLFGNISYGSDKDKALVEKAREKSAKDHLYYVIPAPTINGKDVASVKTKFSLRGTKLTVHATGLNRAHYPLSIDPSFVMNTSNCSWSGGNSESNVSYSGCNLSRGAMVSGNISSWSTATNGTNRTVDDPSSAVAYNGYLYVVGELVWNGSNFSRYSTVQYAQINSSTGQLGAFHYTDSSTDYGTTPTGSFNPVTITDYAVTAYNGYIYVVGGRDGANGMSTARFARLNTNGTVGTWADSGSTMTVHRLGSTVAAYNGYLYAFGGCTNFQVNVCQGASGAVDKGKVAGDGTVTWSSGGSNMLSAHFSGGGTVYNGYLYAVGGCTSWNSVTKLCNTYGTTTEYAPIQSNGSVGSWTASSAFPVTSSQRSVIAYGGYLHVIGGTATAGVATATTYIASIYANGSIGAWRAETSLPETINNNGVTTYNGYVYSVGGCISAIVNCNGGVDMRSSIRFAKIANSLGDTSGYTAPAAYEASGSERYRGATVAYAGHLYVIGGSKIGATSTSELGTTRYATINADGSIGSWSTFATAIDKSGANVGTCVSSNCAGRYGMAAAAYNGYLYIAGGASAGTTYYWADVQSIALNPTTGVPTGTWNRIANNFVAGGTTVGQYATAGGGRSKLSMTIYNGYLYLSGGINQTDSVIQQGIYYGTLNNSGGFTTSTSTALTATAGSGLPDARYDMQTFATGGNFYVAGGISATACTGGTIAGACTDIKYVSINSSTGALGSSWTNANTGSSYAATGAVAGVNASLSNGYLYIVSGQTAATGSAGTTTVYMSKLDRSTGLFGSWSTVQSYNTARFQAGSAIFDNYLYVIGGCDSASAIGNCTATGNVKLDYQYAQIYNGAGGADGAWVGSSNDMIGRRMGHGTFVYNGYMYVMGGCSQYTSGTVTCNSLLQNIEYAPVNVDGSLGAWSTTTGTGLASGGGNLLPTVNWGFGSTIANGYVYIAGGCISGSPTSVCRNLVSGISYTTDAVNYARICTATTFTDGCNGLVGTVGTWQTGPVLASARSSMPLEYANGYLYYSGGDTGSGAGYLNEVRSAQVNASTGAIGAWGTVNGTSTLPSARYAHEMFAYGGYMYVVSGNSAAGGFQSDVYYAQINSGGQLSGWTSTTKLDIQGDFIMFATNGYMYAMGGSYATGGNSAWTQYAPILPNGKIGDWTVTGGYTSNSGALGAAFTMYNGYVYKLGGWVSGAFPVVDVDYGILQVSANTAQYSVLLKTDAPTMPVNYFTNVNLQNAYGSSVSVGFSWASTTNTTFSAVSNQTSFGSTDTKYSLSINGSGASYYWVPVVLDDSQSVTFDESGGSSISYYQLNYHPNAGMRLRGGKTFNDQTQQSLDAP